jgi:hypothetical protein
MRFAKIVGVRWKPFRNPTLLDGAGLACVRERRE